MRLAEELDRLRRQRAALPPEDVRTLEGALEHLRMLQVAEHGPAPDEPFPDFALPDADGTIWRSEGLLARGPLVVAFFRGGWCQYCDATIRAVDRVAANLAAAGVGIVGILPENASALAVTRAEKGVRFPLLSDGDGRLTRLCGLAFDLIPEQIVFYREHYGLDLPQRHAGTGWRLPVPGSYLLRTDGTVAFAFADADHTRRAEPDALLEAARRIATEIRP